MAVLEGYAAALDNHARLFVAEALIAAPGLYASWYSWVATINWSICPTQ